MTSGFDAPNGPASSLPPPPPRRSPVEPTLLEAALAVSTPMPPPPPPAPSPPPEANPANPAHASIPPPPPVGTLVSASSSADTISATPASCAPLDDGLGDLLARIDAEPDDQQLAAPDSNPKRAPEVGAALTDPRDLARPARASDIVIESDGGLEFDPTFAGVGQRALALLVDVVIVNLAAVPGVLLISRGGSTAVLGALLVVVAFIAVVTVMARMITSSGQTLGNRVAGERVVDAINGSNIDVGRAWLRTAVRHAISPILLFGFLVAFADPQRRTFHDRLAGTVVIGRPREVWTVGMPDD